MKPTVLVVDDEPLQREIMKTILDGEGYETFTASSGAEALALIGRRHPEVVLTDLKMKGMDGLALLAAIPAEPVPPAVILITAHGTIASAVEAVHRGALDYLTKPLDKDQVLLAVKKACERTAILRENERLRQALFDRFRFEGIVGRAPRMAALLEVLKKVAGTTATVMIRGESGTGKELVARAIHYNSPRRARPFTALNCAAIPENLFESELFGHEAGAFTGAAARREGLFEVANGGTLFLDEIGDMPLAMQSKLLRVLQDREIRRVGGKETVRIDVRLLSATNKDLEQEMEKGTFPRGSLLPAQCRFRRAAAAARAHRGYSGAGRAFSRKIQRRVRQAAARDPPRGAARCFSITAGRATCGSSNRSLSGRCCSAAATPSARRISAGCSPPGRPPFSPTICPPKGSISNSWRRPSSRKPWPAPAAWRRGRRACCG